jgi:rhamnosyltransferase subunit B
MPPATELLLANVGSAGDTHPFIAMGHAMQARGHTVAMFSNREHAQSVKAAGLRFIDAGPGIEYTACISNPDLWHPIKGMGVLWRHILAPSIAPLYSYLQEQHRAGKAIHVVAGPQMLGARLAQLHLGTHLTSAYTAPSMLRSCQAPLTIANTYWPRGTPRWWLRGLWRAVDRYKLEPMARRKLGSVCAELGLPVPATRSIFGQWMHATKGIALYPSWFAPAKDDCPTQLRFGDFPRYQLDALQALPTDIQHFLDQGPPPIVVSLGTGMAHGHTQWLIWQTALQQLGLRGIFLSSAQDQWLTQPAPHILQASYAPFSLLLPRCTAIVHHGGIGTIAQALAAGLPQIIQACAHDQFENARCVSALGVGQRLARNANPAQCAKVLQRWLPSALSARTVAALHNAVQRSQSDIATLCRTIEAA